MLSTQIQCTGNFATQTLTTEILHLTPNQARHQRMNLY
jgi:hypothetical protein